jgi:hypothetical protein
MAGDFVLQDGRPLSGPERLAIHARTAGPPDPARVGRWRREMDPAERRRFETVAGDLLRDLGYETE